MAAALCIAGTPLPSLLFNLFGNQHHTFQLEIDARIRRLDWMMDVCVWGRIYEAFVDNAVELPNMCCMMLTVFLMYL